MVHCWWEGITKEGVVTEDTIRKGRGPWAGRDGIQNPGERINFRQKNRKRPTSLYQSKHKGTKKKGDKSRHEPFLSLVAESWGGTRRQLSFSLKHRSQTQLSESARGGGGYTLHSELGSAIPGEHQMQIATQNSSWTCQAQLCDLHTVLHLIFSNNPKKEAEYHANFRDKGNEGHKGQIACLPMVTS